MKKLTALLSLIIAFAIFLPSCRTDDTDVYSAVSVPEISEGELPEDISKADLSGMDFGFTDRDMQGNYADSDIAESEISADSYNITKAGTYILSGEITDKTVHIAAADTDKVQIVLDNVNITNSLGPAIYIESADKVFITVKDGTQNSISDGSDYNLNDANGNIDGAVFSRADLTVNGSGSLTLNGNYKHGIVCKDELVIVNASLAVSAKNVAVNGKDCVKISGATLDLNAGSDGIRSDNDTDASRGYVYIESGKININAANDGIQAETAIKIQTAEINIVSGGGSSGRLNDSTESYKGIKASSDVLIYGGNYNIDSLDDCIHSNNTICIEGGTFSLASSDDGVHADTDLAITTGEITVTKSYEGLESSRIFISGGNIDITASDDGINAAGGNDASAENNPYGQPDMNGQPGRKPGGFGMDAFDNGVGEIVVSGGYMHINASGDGIDSNGSFALSGGVVLVSGPTNNGNGSFDYGSGAKVTGGVLIATGSAGMAQGFSEAENQGAILISVGNQSAGTSIAVCDEDGNCIASFTPDKAYQSLVITAPEIKQGGKYSIYTGVQAEDTDKNGFARNVKTSGGSRVTEIQMDNTLYGGSGGMGGGMGGGMAPGDIGGGQPGGKPGGRR